MNLLKDERTMRLDELQLAGDEALELYAAAADHLDDDARRAQIAAHERRQRELLGRIAAHRRERGEQPQAGDPELPSLESAGARLLAAVQPEDRSHHFEHTLTTAAARVQAAVDATQAVEVDDTLRTLIDTLGKDVDALLRASD